MVVIVKDAKWFHLHHGLRNKGEDILGLSKKEILKSKIYEVFGPMASKSGWKFKNYVTLKVAIKIVQLY
jgi:hypothetical protein